MPNNETSSGDLAAENAKLRAALIEARTMLANWGADTSDFVQKKWDLGGDLAKIDRVLKETEHG